MRPLADIKVLDFSTLLPGPMATLMLAEAGAEVIKVERPPVGDGMRTYEPEVAGDSLFFALLNRGKKSIAVDLKDPRSVERIRALIAGVDILVEQFRPGVMDRLGLGYEAMRAINPKLVYCSITGYGQTGPKAQKAGHDLNYVAESGLLSLVTDSDGSPKLPHTLIADIGGGAYPAFMNILLALLNVQKSNTGCHIDIAMNDFTFPFAYMTVGQGLAANMWPEPNGLHSTGASPRYNIYRTSDGRYLAAAPLEEHFWKNFCEVIGLEPALRDDTKDSDATLAAVRASIARNSSAYWLAKFADVDACVSAVASTEEAVLEPHLASRGVFSHQLAIGGRNVPATPVPIADIFRGEPRSDDYPALGESNGLLEPSPAA